MKIRINELRGRMAYEGRPVTLEEIAIATGISYPRLNAMKQGSMKMLRLEYIDALCAYFGVEAGELLEAEPVKLPLDLNIRPDRHGRTVGTRTKEE